MLRANRYTIPRALAFLGEIGPCVIHDPNARGGRGRFYGLDFDAGAVLCSNDRGTELWILRPRVRDAEVKVTDQAIRAARLYERFSHRDADAFVNTIVPRPVYKRPRFAGELVIIRYHSDKRIEPEDYLEDDEDGLDTGVVEYEHYFERPGDRPEYPQIFDLGGGQYWIPPGPYRVKPEGIAHSDEEQAR